MQIKVVHPETNEIVLIDQEEANIDFEKYKLIVPESQLDRMINNLQISAEGKVLLLEIKKVSLEIGGKLVSIGQKILESIVYLVKKHPHMVVGGIIGATIGLLISSIPIIGWLIGWLVMPLCTALGLAFGFWEDMKQKNINEKINSHIKELYSDLAHLSVKA